MRALVEKRSHGTAVVRLAMRYGTNHIQATLKALHEEFSMIRELVVLPLFPQYSSPSSASVYDEVFRFYTDKNRRCVPGLRTIRDYAEHPIYIESIATSILDAMHKHLAASKPAGGDSTAAMAEMLKGAAVVLSYHSVPYRYVQEGDDYPQRCEATTRAVQVYLEKSTGTAFADSMVHVYHSQVGSQKWLGPRAVDAAAALPLPAGDARKPAFSEACGNLALASKQAKVCFVVAPGFAVDCVETIYDLGEEASHVLTEHGGSDFIYIPCLNNSEAQLKTIAAVLESTY